MAIVLSLDSKDVSPHRTLTKSEPLKVSERSGSDQNWFANLKFVYPITEGSFEVFSERLKSLSMFRRNALVTSDEFTYIFK